MVKIDVISGFLGAGKTTLIKRLFENAFSKEKIVLIENEFGEIGIDGSFLKESGVNIKEINSGCICCSLVGDFAKSLKEVVYKFNPERIIIEPSGVGKLSDIVGAISKVDLDLKINILCTVVDGGKCKMYMKNFGEFYNDQVSEANTIVISKTDKLSEEKIISAVDTIRELNKKATIITTPLIELDGDTLLKHLEQNINFVDELVEELKNKHFNKLNKKENECHHHDHDNDECGCHHHDHDNDECGCHHHDHDNDECECHDHNEEECGCHHHHHNAEEVFTSIGIETPTAYSRNELEKILIELCSEKYGDILRSKGIVKASDNDRWYYFDLVSGDYEIRTGSVDIIGRICVIGSKIKEERIRELFVKKV